MGRGARPITFRSKEALGFDDHTVQSQGEHVVQRRQRRRLDKLEYREGHQPERFGRLRDLGEGVVP